MEPQRKVDFMKILELLYHILTLPCPFHKVTGYYCPGCGGTRSVYLLLHGHFLWSTLYHPLVPYVTILVLYSMLHILYDHLRPTGHPPYRFRNAYLYIGIAILVVQCLVKNIALYYGYDILQLYPLP